MAKPFAVPAWRKRQINAKYRRKGLVINSAVTQMEAVMKHGVEYVIANFLGTGHWHPPTLNGMHAVSDRFYRSVIDKAFESAQEEKTLQVPDRKRLAKGPTGIPKRLRDLKQIFRNSAEWRKIMKRSGRLSARLKEQYVEKLRSQFDKVVPQLREGKISPDEAKQAMMEAWDTSKAKVETIFRTETTNYFGRTQVAFFEGDREIIGFLFDSIRDTSRTEICKSRHGLVYRPGTQELRDNTPACHFNCRSHLIALANTPYNRKLLDDPERDPAKKTVAPLPPGWRK